MRKKGEEKVEVPTVVASKDVKDYTGAPFYIGQIVTITKPIDIEKILVDVSGVANKKNVRDVFSQANDKISRLELSGKIVDISEDYENNDHILTLNLGEEFPFTTAVYPFDILFPDKKSFFITEQSNCGYIKGEETEKDPDIKSFVSFMSLSANKSVEKKCESVLAVKEEEEKTFNKMKELRASINSTMATYQEVKIRSELIKESVRKELESTDETSIDFHDYYKNIFKNKDVKEVKVTSYNGEECLMLVTNELYYKEVGDNHRHNQSSNPDNLSIDRCEFNIGAYVVLLFKNGKILASNYSRFIGAGQHHPCIDGNSSVCTGTEFQKALRNACEGNDFASAIHYTIDFLKDPNSNSPYIDSVNFYYTQERKYKPTNLIDLIGNNSKYKETWNEAQYKKDREDLVNKLKK